MAVNTGVNELVLDEVFGLYTAAEQIMLQKMAARIKKGALTPGWNEQKLNDVQAMRLELEQALNNIRGTVTPGITRAVLSSYIAGMNAVNKSLKLPSTLLKDTPIPYHVQRLVLEANGIVQGASMQILRSTADIYKSVVTDSTSVMLTGVETRLDASQRALNVFAAKGITGFIDKAGRQWEMGSYTEMAVRTVSARAALQGHIDRSTEFGHDLMIVSQFGRTCPICAPWEGVPLSISGKTPGYKTLASAKAAGLFHPNCKHTLLAYFPDITEVPEREPNDDVGYQDMQTQRYNERQIRVGKRLEAAAMTPAAVQKARARIATWQQVQRDHMEKTGLTRKYKREGIKNRTGNAAKAMFGKHTLELDSGKPLIDPHGYFKPPVLPNRNKPKSPAKPKPVAPPKPKERAIEFKGKSTLRPNMDAIDPLLVGRVITDINTRMAKNARKVLADKQNEFNFMSKSNEDSGYYQHGMRLVRVDKILDDETKNTRGKFATLYHEIGHAMDYAYGRPSKNSAEYMQALKDDWFAIQHMGGHDSNFRIAQQRMNDIKYDDKSNGVQDIVGGLSQRKISARWGHSLEYWNREDVWKEATSELFAHMYQATTDQSAERHIKEWFPNSWKWFNGWLDKQ